jgi:hypothetical protein
MEVNWQMLAVLSMLFLAWNGFLVWIIKYLVDRAVKGGDRRMGSLENSVDSLSGDLEREADKRRELEKEYRKHIADLPLLYVQREDWIRLGSIIEGKMDTLNNKFDALKDYINARN